ncbi:GTP-binding protein EngA [Reticulomyxa filosa]|uniref:GTP-binding protein EngA n=1 Tax=Reticulomyxa filosa TaxID=46433 RepID=X6MND1_RETFI|nr:GTP-binding protein EngA [Reticulomyxa filosa]|eukprot:ETO15181.1 GTP-binding protein EngA [Reticulomyxa filosa]
MLEVTEDEIEQYEQVSLYEKVGDFQQNDNNSSSHIIAKDFELRLCIIGRPNTGKSSLMNAILGEDRCLVEDMPGIARESIAVPIGYIFHSDSL